jgi:hypothetical protein
MKAFPVSVSVSHPAAPSARSVLRAGAVSAVVADSVAVRIHKAVPASIAVSVAAAAVIADSVTVRVREIASGASAVVADPVAVCVHVLLAGVCCRPCRACSRHGVHGTDGHDHDCRNDSDYCLFHLKFLLVLVVLLPFTCNTIRTGESLHAGKIF